MATMRRNPSPSPSISSIASEITSSDMSPEEADVRNFVKKRLIKRMFLGHYQERRFVEFLGVYRDMVVLHHSETEMEADIDRVQSRLISFYGDGKWLGITNPNTIGAPAAGHCFWTKLQDVAFGFYWFQIRQMRFEEREIVVRLKVIRAVNMEVITPVTSTSFTKTISDNVDTLKTRIQTTIHSLRDSQSCLLDGAPNASSPTEHVTPESNKKCTESPSKTKTEAETNPAPDSTSDGYASTTVKDPIKIRDLLVLLQLMVHHWREIFLFLSVAVVSTLEKLGKCVEFVGNFTLKFMHEVAFVIRTVTPIILAVIELVGKVIGGFYILVAMIFRGANGPPPPPARQIGPVAQSRRPAILYNDQQPRSSGSQTQYRRPLRAYNTRWVPE